MAQDTVAWPTWQVFLVQLHNVPILHPSLLSPVAGRSSKQTQQQTLREPLDFDLLGQHHEVCVKATSLTLREL